MTDEWFHVAEAIRKKWGPIGDARGALFVPMESRTVLLVWSIGPVIDNGGFERLLEGQWSGDEDLQNSIAAFRQIGCEEVANIISFVMSHYLLQHGSSSFDAKERLAALDAAFPSEAREELNGRFWDQHDRIEKKLAGYIATNNQQIDEQLRLDLKSYPPLSR